MYGVVRVVSVVGVVRVGLFEDVIAAEQKIWQMQAFLDPYSYEAEADVWIVADKGRRAGGGGQVQIRDSH